MLPIRLRNEILKHQEDAEGDDNPDSNSVPLPPMVKRNRTAPSSNLVPSFLQEEEEEGGEADGFWRESQVDEEEGEFDRRSASKYSKTKSNASSRSLQDLAVNMGGEEVEDEVQVADPGVVEGGGK